MPNSPRGMPSVVVDTSSLVGARRMESTALDTKVLVSTLITHSPTSVQPRALALARLNRGDALRSTFRRSLLLLV
jgi:hypothetical protein